VGCFETNLGIKKYKDIEKSPHRIKKSAYKIA